ncbi:CRISPR-associated protein [Actinomadura rubteroloni]|uniref:CRISPR-associated protein n=1 Tax=Actinomadura rubteroloni TaxID=1926885 RepID=A0A2P4UIY6_9ACTN|nr:type I-U CRISPR-associated RAMP protein Csb1/Cas7u [Actinomadura rubteroloni]POM24986.1 CRISPR-associated protein [Actinomadura rubteroloni]
MTPTNPHRIRFSVDLRPALGSTFQPTGFPDLGPATFTRYTDTGELQECLLVESVQSMANRLEGAAWDEAARDQHPVFSGLPYVRVHRAGDPEAFLTSSRLEAHRLASAFVREAELDGTKMLKVIAERLHLAKDTPLDRTAMARALLALDPFALLHGVFFNQKEWFGQPRFARAVSAVIEAYDVRQAVSGGRKSDHVRHQLDKNGTGGGTKEGYGSIPFHRVEWTARTITAMFTVDVELLSSYGLGDDVTDLLTAIALWEIRSLLTGGLRLRTACDLDPVGDLPEELPTLADLTDRITGLISACRAADPDVFGVGGPLPVAWKAA